MLLHGFRADIFIISVLARLTGAVFDVERQGKITRCMPPLLWRSSASMSVLTRREFALDMFCARHQL
jgi:hypothetical protein